MKFRFLQRNLSVLFVFSMCMFLCASCGNNTVKPKQKDPDPQKVKDQMLNVNKSMVEKEDRQIDDFISRHQWNMIKTSTGLRYMIYAPAKNSTESPVDKQIVRIKYGVKLVNGVEVYNSDKNGLKEFVLGKSEAENGLEEGLKLMHKGDKAMLIIPSHLAYGLAGDDENIPKRATLIYDVELLDIR